MHVIEPVTLCVGAIGTNCYLVPGEDGGCAVIDPGDDADLIRAALSREGLTPCAILLTHGHFDHIGAVNELHDAYGCPVIVGREDAELLENPALSYGRTERFRITPDRLVDEGDEVACAGRHFAVLAAPGHTKGGVCYRCEDALFCGDTLFAGSCGRTDLYGGNGLELLRSLRRLAALDEHVRIFPGHGESSTIGAEVRTNPTLAIQDESLFSL